jgi:hypothetical protein
VFNPRLEWHHLSVAKKIVRRVIIGAVEPDKEEA